MREEDIKVIASFLHRVVEITAQIQKESGSKLIKDLLRVANDNQTEGAQALKALRKDVRQFATKWPLPGVDVKTLKRPAGIEEDA
jgi:glycine hydroxymethyltransferase